MNVYQYFYLFFTLDTTGFPEKIVTDENTVADETREIQVLYY